MTHGALPALSMLNLPNLLTTAGMLCSLGALLTVGDSLRLGVSLFALALLLDRVDGMVARRLGLSSPFGMQLDSLADLLGFCLVPAAVAYGAPGSGLLDGVLAAVWLCAGAWRLAWFNVHGMDEDGRFSGVPTTMAAAWFLAGGVGAVVFGIEPVVVFRVLLPLGAVAMLSRLPIAKSGPVALVSQLAVLASLVAAWIA